MKKIINLFLVSLFLFSFISCQKKTISLEGHVYEMFKNTPMQNIELNIDGNITKTDKVGYYKISKLNKNRLTVKIEKTDRYNEFTDNLVLDQNKNIRDFVIEAKNPFNIPEDDIYIPYFYHYSINIGLSPDKITTIAEVDTSPMDSALRIIGKEYSFENNKTNETDIELVQIGLSTWVKDKDGFWNMIDNSGESLFRINTIFNEKYDIASNFYKNPEIEYKETEIFEVIDGLKTRRYDAVYIEKESQFVDNLGIYIISEGEYIGAIKKIISNSKMRSAYPYVEIVLSKYNEDLKIEPPSITK